MGVSTNGGTSKQMVYKGKGKIKLDENSGYPQDSGNLFCIYIYINITSIISIYNLNMSLVATIYIYNHIYITIYIYNTYNLNVISC